MTAGNIDGKIYKVRTEGAGMLKDNCDLNIWDKVGWETEYEKEGWSIAVYTVPKEGASYGSGDFLVSIDLEPHEAKRLTLGVSMRDGGDYAPDHDFWMDVQSFFVTYRDIPKRVEDVLWKLAR